MQSEVRDQDPSTPAVRHPGAEEFGVTLLLDGGFEQTVDFGIPGAQLTVDEPAPLGAGKGPNPVRLLAAAIGSCLAASLMFCLRKARVDVRQLRTVVRGGVTRNARGRLRVSSITVRLVPVVSPADADRVVRCIGAFEDYCIVTATVRQGIPINVEVAPATA